MLFAELNRPWPLRALGGKYGYLVTALILLLAFSPLIVINRAWSLAIATLTSAILVACIYAASPRRLSITLGLVLAITDLVIGQVAAVEGWQLLYFAQFVLGMAIMLYAVGVLLQAILGGGRVTIETLQAALCVYLLLGMIWSHLYSLTQLLWPDAIRVTIDPTAPTDGYKLLKYEFLHMLYFSYATLTTVGMESVVPVSNVARMLVCFEAITGQVYLTMLIARLVGMHIAQGQVTREPDDFR